jgi:hypothetical protein
VTWLELREQLTELGFNVVNYEYEDIYKEMKNAYIFAANRAVEVIAATVRPIIGEFVINKYTPKEKNSPFGYYKYDISKFDERFYDLANDYPMMEIAGNYVPFVDYQTTPSRKYILVPRCYTDISSVPGSKFHVYYEKTPIKITDETKDEFELELDRDVQPLVPLLAAHWVWLDDEPQKAAIFYNEYETLKVQILTNSEDTKVKIEQKNTTGWW